MSRLRTALLYGLVLVLAVELALWGAFLVCARPFGLALPVAALVAAVGNALVGWAGWRVLRRPLGAAVPGLIWLAVALALGERTAVGDLVVPGTWRGVAFLMVGAASAAVTVGVAAAKHGATPEGETRR